MAEINELAACITLRCANVVTPSEQSVQLVQENVNVYLMQLNTVMLTLA